MFIEVVQIYKDAKESKGSDSRVVNPKSGKPIEKYQFHLLTINSEEISSFRKWFKDPSDSEYVNGGMIQLLMRGEDRKGQQAHVLVNEEYESFLKRLDTNAIKLTDEQKRKTSYKG